MVDHIAPQGFPPAHIFRIEADVLIRQLLDAVAGHLGHAAGTFHRHVKIIYPVNAKLHIQAAGIIEPVNLLGNGGNQGLHGRQGRQNDEMVIGKAGNEIIGKILLQHRRHFKEELISLLAAVPKIVETEIVDIYINKCQLRRLRIQRRHGHGHGRMLQEPGLSWKAGEGVNIINLVLGVIIQEEHIKHRSHTGHKHPVAELLHPPDRTVLSDNAVIDEIQLFRTAGNLIPDILIYPAPVLRMHQGRKRTARGLHEILKGRTAEHTDHPGIGI